MKIKKMLGVLFGLVSTTSGCTASKPSVAQEVKEVKKGSNASVTTSRQNEIGWSLYRSKAKAGQNILLSPTSIYVALALTYEGSQGKVRDEADTFMAIPKGHPTPSLMTDLARLGGTQELDFKMANGIWTDQKAHGMKAPTPTFVAIAKKNYSAEVANISFEPPDKVVGVINDFIDHATNGHIKKMLETDNLKNKTAAIVNAVYFKGLWSEPFEKSSTKIQDFYLNQQMKKNVSMMSQTRSQRYFANDQVQILELSYRGGNVAMDVVLPKEGQDIEAFEKDLSAGQIEAWLGQMAKTTVEARLPKFEMRWGTENVFDSLKAQGMPTQGDFAPIGASDFEIAAVYHQAWVKVDEEGTEASAATVVAGREGAMPRPPEQFTANRPFLFIIRDLPSKTWLFVGRVSDPK